MSHILLVTSSPRGSEGLSTRYASQLAKRLAAQRPGTTLTVRDLAAAPLNHIGEAYVVGRATPPGARTAAQTEAVRLAESLVAELAAADTVVIGSAMINFGPPSSLKAWFDHVTWPGVTFRYAGNSVEGLLKGKKVYLVTAAGGNFSEGPLAAWDHQSGYLKHLLGFIGLTDIEHLRVEGMAHGPEAAQAAIASADEALQSLLKRAAASVEVAQ
ncbi:FMN-dependent NADH-azoreductase [Hydrogenophaga flava]|uniref:FMN-dependent NADH-azoreductase n=1 Tax=Hydrogenophaga flava TaxID=65657 RepID=UPI0008254B9D|nr:NAD(P)H-dependent oxidoreductase [Hydrogenophaga flava]